MTDGLKIHAARVLRSMHRLRKNARGVALIEFAMVFPILVVLYLGGFQLMDAVSVYRKVTTTTRSLADLSTQMANVNEASVQTVLDASAQIMAPYAASGGTYRISLINVDSAGVATVEWSQSKSGTGELSPGAAYALPANIKQNDLDMIVCDVVYTYRPIAFFSLMGNIPFRDQIFMIPRNGSTVAMEQ
jgi:Flp pilus assembly protein TadG